jgi:hypothetical protein
VYSSKKMGRAPERWSPVSCRPAAAGEKRERTMRETRTVMAGAAQACRRAAEERDVDGWMDGCGQRV